MFDPSKSSSYQYLEQSRFQVSYMDNSKIQGFVAHDVVQIGTLTTWGYFGIITNITGIWVGNGIFGLGFPRPSNILGRSILSQSIEKEHIFSMVLGNSIGELQIGGFIPEAIDPMFPSMVQVDILPDCSLSGYCEFQHYRIPIDGIRVGSHSIVKNETKLTAVLDSGTTCIIVPGQSGTRTLNIYEAMIEAFESQEEAPLFISIQGHEFEISHEDLLFWHRAQNIRERLCILSIEAHPDLFILGDAFMRTILSVYNLTSLERPTVTLAKRNPSYPERYNRKLKESNVKRYEMKKHRDLRLGGPSLNSSLVRVPLKHAQIQYTIEVAIGTPPQVIKDVILDTGSSVFAIKLHRSSTIGVVAGTAIATAVFVLLFVLTVFHKQLRGRNNRNRLPEVTV